MSGSADPTRVWLEHLPGGIFPGMKACGTYMIGFEGQVLMT